MTGPRALQAAYAKARLEAEKDLKGDAVTHALWEITEIGLDYLVRCDLQPLSCDVPGKTYVTLIDRTTAKHSRPVNDSLFDVKVTRRYAKRVLSGDRSGISPVEIARVLYSCAMAYCAATDLTH